MSEWAVIHRVRYPPFDDKRIKADAAPIAETIVKSNLDDDQVLKCLPPYKIQSDQGWLIERVITNQDGRDLEKMTVLRIDERPFVKLINQQRRGWYILPNNLHRYARSMISAAVIFLLSTLVYLFLEPLLSEIGIPSFGTKSIQIGLLDYPILSIIVVPVIMLPIGLRLVANFVDLKRQQDFFQSPVEQPKIEFSPSIISGQPLKGTIQIPHRLPD